jgi:hypothetical protein
MDRGRLVQASILNQGELHAKASAFYRDVLAALTEAGLPFLVGGALALRFYAGIVRHTKDLDIFLRFEHYPLALKNLAERGYRTEVTDIQWLAKAFSEEHFVDIIFGSGKGLGLIDQGWFDHAVDGEILGLPVGFCPPEETIWSKAFIMERERYDGADVAHLLRACGSNLDWPRLLQRFGPHWRVLFSHLVLFGFIYPSEQSQIPGWVLTELVDRFQDEMNSSPRVDRICQGTFLSGTQYLIDLERWGYQDARLPGPGQRMPGR